MAFTLQLAGASVGDLNLNDQTSPSGAHPYSILVKGWRPRVARRRTGQLGGVPYEDVEEVLPLAVLGYTRAAVLDGLGDLAAALDEARLWFLGAQDVGPIVMKWLPEGSSLGTAVQAAVLGPGGGDDLLSLQPAFNKDLQAYYVECDLGLVRRGMWLGPETAKSTAGTTNPEILTSSAFTDVPSVESLSFGNYFLQTGDASFVYVAYSSDVTGLTLFEAETPFTWGGGLSSVVDSDASGGSIARMSTSYIDAAATYRIVGPTAGSYAVYATMRNNSASIAYTVTLSAKSYFVTRNLGVQNRVVIEPSFGPKPVYLGNIYVPAAADYLYITISIHASSIVTAGNALDYDTVLVVALDKQSGVIYNPEFMIPENGSSFGRTSIDHKLLMLPSGGVFRMETSKVDSPVPYLGNPYSLAKGTATYSIIYGCTTGHWRVMRFTGGVSYTINSSSVTVTRRPYYLIPK